MRLCLRLLHSLLLPVCAGTSAAAWASTSATLCRPHSRGPRSNLATTVISTLACCAGDRTTLRRATLDEPIVSGGAFRTAAGPGVACLTHTGNLLVHSLPGLEVLLAAPLQRALGFPFCAAPGGAGLVSLLPTPAAAELWADGPKPSQHAADESSGLPKVLPSSPSNVVMPANRRMCTCQSTITGKCC